jgi:hypothetical protein
MQEHRIEQSNALEVAIISKSIYISVQKFMKTSDDIHKWEDFPTDYSDADIHSGLYVGCSN